MILYCLSLRIGKERTIKMSETNEERLFDNKGLKRLILPLIAEQFLTTFMGMADTLMVSTVGEAAVSGVSLVDTINVLIINIFAALATGGAVVAGQSLGCGDKKAAVKSGEQLIFFGTLSACLVMILMYAGRWFILHVLFGKITPEVMHNADTYLMIVNLSIPFIAVYNCCAALFRTMGNSKITMIISLAMNFINISGNAVLIFGFKMGVAGAAIPTLLSRIFAAVTILILLRNERLDIHVKNIFKVRFDWGMTKKILHIGIPNGVENSMFQLGKILLLSLVSTFGTASITANAISNTVAGFEVLPGMAIGLAMVTVVSRCVGKGDCEQARYYVRKLMKYAICSMFILNIIITVALPVILDIFNLTSETKAIAQEILTLHGLLAIFIWPFSFTLPNALRAANDVNFTMIVGMCSMWIVRIGAGYLLAEFFGFGVLGVWLAMFLDWVVRGIFFTLRYRGNKWEGFH